MTTLYTVSSKSTSKGSNKIGKSNLLNITKLSWFSLKLQPSSNHAKSVRHSKMKKSLVQQSQKPSNLKRKTSTVLQTTSGALFARSVNCTTATRGTSFVDVKAWVTCSKLKICNQKLSENLWSPNKIKLFQVKRIIWQQSFLFWRRLTELSLMGLRSQPIKESILSSCETVMS